MQSKGNKMKRQPTNGIFANHVFDKRQISKVHKELLQLISKKEIIIRQMKNKQRT